MPIDRTDFLESDGVRLAYRASQGKTGLTGVVWLGGFHSDMLGEKAGSLHASCAEANRPFLRFDYSGHGESGGRFEDGTIGRWRSDALAMIDASGEGPRVLVGSSMGGWMALMCALARPQKVKAVVLLAPAPDMTERLMWNGFTDEQKREVSETGRWMRPSAYDPAGYPITRALIEEGRNWLIMDQDIPLDIPIRILHGGLDEDVPWTHSFEVAAKLRSEDLVWTFVKDGDHRLSRPQDISLLIRTVLATCDQVDASA